MKVSIYVATLYIRYTTDILYCPFTKHSIDAPVIQMPDPSTHQFIIGLALQLVYEARPAVRL